MEKRYHLVVIGGGAGGIFGAIAAKSAFPNRRVLLIEKTATLLAKVRISGGGRCNVTHHCFDPALLIKNYPRGGRELIGPFHRFQPIDTIQWFESRGVPLKTEKDGRIFPKTDSSQTIIDCLLSEAKKIGVEIRLREKIESIKKERLFILNFKEEFSTQADSLLLATGNHPQGHLWAKELGHTIVKPIPSLFTFNVPESPLKDYSGISVEAELKIEGTSLSQTGPLLITHFGFSGPAAIKLSAWGAKYLYEQDYHWTLKINWLPQKNGEEIYQDLFKMKSVHPQRTLLSLNPFHFPKNLWKYFCGKFFHDKIGSLPNRSFHQIADKLHGDLFQVRGKTTNKEEFVTCGGINLSEVNFQTMESKQCPGLYFAGEILDIDGVTGGFNFQNAWTTGFIAGSSALPSPS